MATTSPRLDPDNPLGSLDPPRSNYADILRPSTVNKKPIPMKPITYLHGEPRVIWEEAEMKKMIQNENLQYAVIGKFSYG
ncbi:hypothetical protein H5410_027250 [Solanum commersonii]|uniref:Uncharacterized protein n=1 Tax=Solanum commersonii TaxID=4109 RepID=A0A9J5Z3W7_SOLCO|nr:hypothetical protein H5410_027250 [Solanum commersonii]